MSSDGEPARDVKNHLLFEIATEVAHRGIIPKSRESCYQVLTQLLYSRRHLLRHQIESPGDYS